MNFLHVEKIGNSICQNPKKDTLIKTKNLIILKQTQNNNKQQISEIQIICQFILRLKIYKQSKISFFHLLFRLYIFDKQRISTKQRYNNFSIQKLLQKHISTFNYSDFYVRKQISLDQRKNKYLQVDFLQGKSQESFQKNLLKCKSFELERTKKKQKQFRSNTLVTNKKKIVFVHEFQNLLNLLQSNIKNNIIARLISSIKKI
ncbi:hypothetical protein TTHERM_000475139 (macronuclear) [Tetrahymena thermophila SB210]|uniref:Uncharacterized protein n=1 Tax=Tetrahymena thermophila (strain SB210) TaxID=312017 RepID=W7X3L8_TETTS|nr:hypothetical protein TTHERM_000475139 [Tetrahymena thermophila SB210]EWS72052.1 hypothetical protein TTHERM_000475139 [Tetrahymena thermophila SB210]|eukprot:XP_012655427.1 hypothetical protein TTHERM_000475139 [Tetrahymena thermophila SB210]